MLKYIINKKGDSSIFQILICISILTFLLFFPIISFSYFKFQMSVDDIGLNALRTAMVRGGVDEEVMDTIVTAFETKGYSFEGNTLNGDDGAKVIIWTNTNLCGDSYTFTTQEGKSYNIEIRDWPAGDETSNPNAYYNSDLRRYRNGYSLYKSGDTYTKVENGTEIKLRITVPISAHSKTINALYGLISPNSDTENIFLNEGYGYSVTYSTLSELYQESQITTETSIKNNQTEVTYVPFELTKDNLEFAGIVPEGDLFIPQTFSNNGTNYKITSIGDSTFYSCNKLTSVTIPNTVTNIGNGAFQSCSKLTNINIPDGITEIKDETFRSCASLKTIAIPDSVTSIGTYAFAYTALEEINFPNNLKSIGSYAFIGCNGLKEIIIPNSVTSVGKSAFQYCHSVTSLTTSGNLTEVGTWAFSSMASLKNLTIGEGTKTIVTQEFYNLGTLETVTIPSSVETIEELGFYNCVKLKTIYIPNENTVIGPQAFVNSDYYSIIYYSGSSPNAPYGASQVMPYPTPEDGKIYY